MGGRRARNTAYRCAPCKLNKELPQPNAVLFKFPISPQRRKEWLAALGMENAVLRARDRVCEYHFAPSEKGGSSRLRRFAVPSSRYKISKTGNYQKDSPSRRLLEQGPAKKTELRTITQRTLLPRKAEVIATVSDPVCQIISNLSSDETTTYLIPAFLRVEVNKGKPLKSVVILHPQQTEVTVTLDPISQIAKQSQSQQSAVKVTLDTTDLIVKAEEEAEADNTDSNDDFISGDL